jgi:site-specific DNA-methyltransferase (adenine-specific)
MGIYFQDDFVTLYHGDSLELMPNIADESFDCVITDPPYTERTHSKVRNKIPGGIREGVSFESFTEEQLNLALIECGRISKSWVIATLDYNHAFKFESQPPQGLRQMRVGVWVKNNPTPQITGDRPAQGWEAISYLHKQHKAKWNAGGQHGNYVTNLAAPTGHPTPKPLSMI